MNKLKPPRLFPGKWDKCSRQDCKTSKSFCYRVTLCQCFRVWSFFVSFSYGYFGVVDISIAPSIIALIFAIIAIVGITTRRKSLRGYTYAVVAIILSLPCISFVTLANINVRLRMYSEKVNTGKYNLHLIGKVIVGYSKDHDGYLPAADKQCDLLMQYNKNLSRANFKHPKIEKGECNFAFNSNLGGIRLSDVPDDVVLLFEANGDWNLSGTAELLETRRSEHGYVDMLYADQSTWTYWFYENGVRSKTSYEHKPPRWKP